MTATTRARIRWSFLAAGVASSLVAGALESVRYSPAALALWLLSLLAPALAFYQEPAAAPREPGTFDRLDLVILAGLLVLFAPLYLFFVYWIPFQMNTDEIVIGLFTKTVNGIGNADLLGPSGYFGFPTLVFVVFGRIARALGGIDLENMRLVHATFGLLIVVPAYLLFRLSFGRASAVVATAVLMCCHSLVFVSRLVLRNNLPALNIAAAFYFLLRGLRRGSRGDLFIGGAIAGLGFYHYPPGRVIFAVWLSYLVAVVLVRRIRRWHPGWGVSLRRAAALSTLGFVLAIVPMVAATRRSPPDVYARRQLLIFPEGREAQRLWYGRGTAAEAYAVNVRQGLATFNQAIPDQAWMYTNVKAAFVDPLTGVLLWVGLIAAGFAVWRKSARADGHLLAVVGFLSLYLLHAFVVTQAPHYTRLLVLLPFVGHLVAAALEVIGAGVVRLAARLRGGAPGIPAGAIAGLLVLPVVAWNGWIIGDFSIRGFVEGQDVGGAARYIGSRRQRAPYTFYLAASKTFGFYNYWWGEPDRGKERLEFSATPQQTVRLLDPEHYIESLGRPPFSVLMGRRLWIQSERRFRGHYPNARVYYVKPDASLIAAEVL